MNEIDLTGLFGISKSIILESNGIYFHGEQYYLLFSIMLRGSHFGHSGCQLRKEILGSELK